tara:strand:+ start:136 stop:345 length:210 start_codon:yes stop_codon:yes gene_type:complete
MEQETKDILAIQKIEICSANVARLLSELEGSSTLLKQMDFNEEKKMIDLMKKRFYSMYFKLKKLEKMPT